MSLFDKVHNRPCENRCPLLITPECIVISRKEYERLIEDSTTLANLINVLEKEEYVSADLVRVLVGLEPYRDEAYTLAKTVVETSVSKASQRKEENGEDQS